VGVSRNPGWAVEDAPTGGDERAAVPLRIAPLLVVGLILVVLAVMAVATL